MVGCASLLPEQKKIPAMAEQVLIEFISDTTGLDSSTDKLEQQGKVSQKNSDEFKKANAELLKQQKTFDDLAKAGLKFTGSGTAIKKNLLDIVASVKGMGANFAKEFQVGVKQSLDKAGVSVKDLQKEIKKYITNEQQLLEVMNALAPTTDNLTTSEISLKKELAAVVKELAKMKLAGLENTKQYQDLIDKGAELKKTMADVADQLKATASNTSNLDGLISITTGIAGGFSVAQGAVALFGKENEDLQKTLLRVNATMAILQGLQSIQNVLQKESAASIFVNTIAQKAYNFVIGTSTGLLKAFRIALALTGVGVFVLLVVALVSALKKSNIELDLANMLLERQKVNIETLNTLIDQRVSKEEAAARQMGALESEVIKIQGRALLARRAAIIESNERLREQQSALRRTSEAWFLLNKQIEDNNDTLKQIDTDLVVKQIALERQLVEERLRNIAAGFATQLAASKKNTKAELELKKQLVRAERDLALNAEGLTGNERLKIIAETNKKIRDLEREFQQVLQEDRIAATEAALSETQTKARLIGERATQAEIDLQKQLVQEKADLELLQEGLTQNQILEIKTTSLNQQLKLQRDFNKQATKEALDDLIARNEKALTQLEIGDAKKLALTIENIIAAAKIEVEANQGNSDKIKEINAKRDQAIREARIASIQSIVEYEIAFTIASSGVLLRGIEDQLQAQARIRASGTEKEKKRIEKETGFKRTSLKEEQRLIDLLTAYESGAIQKRIDALNKQRADKLISEKDYNLQYTQLVDDQAKVIEDGEKRKQNAINETTESAKEQARQFIETTLQVASQLVDLLDSLGQAQSDKESQALEERKQKLKELQDAGAISEKEAITRQKRIEADEKRVRQQQAQREKQIAVFKALIAIPEAVLQGLSQGGPILAAIYGALAAAQAAIIISRPIPKFGKGKKNNYEGLAEVGETGAELIEHNGKMYVADKPQVVWLSKQDKVFNPQETERMLTKSSMSTETPSLTIEKKGFQIDYKRLGKEVGKHTSTTVYVDGIKEQHISKQAFFEYLNKRRGW